MKFKKEIFCGLFFALLLAACGKDSSIPDVSDIPVEVKIHRFERALFALDTNNMATGLEQLKAKYPAFSRVFLYDILKADAEEMGEAAYVKGFVTHPAVRRLYDTCQVVFPDMKAFEPDFRQAFQYLKYYFPDEATPDLTTFVSEYGVGNFIFTDSNSLAIGLDFFLGADYPYQAYNPTVESFSFYLTRTFTKEHLVSKTLQPLVQDMLGAPGGMRLLDLMVHNGKNLYVLDKLLPNTPDSIKLEITAQQTQWLLDNEKEMWSYFLKENLFYSNNLQNIRKYVEYSPNSPGMPPEAPGRTANWLGWQIVKAYMTRFPQTTMQELITLKDAQVLLDNSKYKPKR